MTKDSVIVDVHSHIYTKSYVNILEKYGMLSRLSEDTVKIGKGKRTALIGSAIIDMDKRLKEIEKFGFITYQILSISRPWTYFLPEQEEIKTARSINDEIAEIINKYPSTFGGLGTLPLNSDINYTIEEAERAVKDLGLNGFIIGTGIGDGTIDLPKFEPLLEVISKLDVPIFLHPGSMALDKIISEDYRTGELVNYLFETTHVLSRIILSGILDKYKLKIVAAHGGGYITYQFGRLDRGYEIYPEIKEKIKKKPSEYLKEIYYDSIVFSKEALEHLIRFAGKEHVMFGTDYPFKISDPVGMKKLLESLDLTEDELELIYMKNAKKLYKLKL
ncbi:Ribosomal protein L11 methyltransferase [Saccharolobus shibatae B12]|uniref:Ribosomal protein L11 methyltransferase n=1 Tax=Saccharolobus shibatae (strain ATCC 51178 / DSM 5389 / JCM 8931 / NBRC 15437 / B12) TaxID=523848 RepID=A0A8F5GTI5_SACSH|nr:amidohydrolase family protein [Saccharolobus shibatae]QXJ28935.1 Ribosomal protein L11 methyltransferase [Saccharolobus shibatae B12]